MDEATRKELIKLLKSDTKKYNEPTQFALIASELHRPAATWNSQVPAIANTLGKKPSQVKVYVDAIKLLLGETLDENTEHLDWVKDNAQAFINRCNNKPISAELKKRLQNVDTTFDGETSLTQAARKMLSYIPDSSDQPGLYCFTYPSTMARNRFKIGMSEQGVKTRLIKEFSCKEQTIQPEDPIILRLWKSDDPKGDEKLFHQLLAREHVENITGGHEWFDTSMNRIDLIAEALLLKQMNTQGGNQ